MAFGNPSGSGWFRQRVIAACLAISRRRFRVSAFARALPPFFPASLPPKHDLTVRKLQAQRVQVDELWSFVGCKDKTRDNGGNGVSSVWTWTAIDADTKLCVSYLVGRRTAAYAREFIADVADRIDSRIQFTSDGLKLYVDAVERVYGGDMPTACSSSSTAKSVRGRPAIARPYAPAPAP